jgi:hypothetical protein
MAAMSGAWLRKKVRYITRTYGDRNEETTADRPDRPPEGGEELNLEPGDEAPATGTLPSDSRWTGSEGPP